MRESISLFRPVLTEEAEAAVVDVLRSGWLGLGPKSAEFEQAFASYVDAPHCVGTSSGSAALQLALAALDLQPGAEVLTTPLTFVSSNQLILQAGLKPVFADVDPRTGNLSVEAVAAALSDSTAALLLVHYGGYPCDLDELYGLAAERGVPVIEDCAHACGAVYRGRRVGSHGDLHAFSFHAVKNLPMGEGGALTVRSAAVDARLRKLRWFGIDADTFSRSGEEGYSWDYDVAELGFKLHLSDVPAAIGLAQLGVLDEENARRAELVQRYRDGLAEVAGIMLGLDEHDRQSSHHLFWLLAEERDGLHRKLDERGIQTGVHYRPSYDYPVIGGERLEGVEWFWRRVLSLPLHLQLRDDDVDRIVATIAEGW